MRRKNGLALIASIMLPSLALVAGCQDDIVTTSRASVDSVDSHATAVVVNNTAAQATLDSVTISGDPSRTVDVGASYLFQSVATSTTHAQLTFAIQNLPRWAVFNSATGELSGSPTSSDIGTSEEISISVGDGTATASLAPFSIVVVQTQNPQVALSWMAPGGTFNGSSLNLAGFRIYYGTDPSALTHAIDIDDPSIIEYAIPGLASGNWYFAMTAYDVNHVESSLTNIITITI